MGIIGVGLCVKNSAAAVALYTEAFGLTLGYHVLNEDGSFFHSELYDGEQEMLSVVEEDSPAAQSNPVQLCYTFEERESLLRAFNLLSDGGRALMQPQPLPWSPFAAELVDRFGIRWYLTLRQHRPEDGWSR